MAPREATGILPCPPSCGWHMSSPGSSGRKGSAGRQPGVMANPGLNPHPHGPALQTVPLILPSDRGMGPPSATRPLCPCQGRGGSARPRARGPPSPNLEQQPAWDHPKGHQGQARAILSPLPPTNAPAVQESQSAGVPTNTHMDQHLQPQTLVKPQAATFLEASCLLRDRNILNP